MTGIPEPTSGELVLAARKGDAEAWNELVRRIGPRVLAVARAHRLSPADAEDVSAVVWLRLVSHLDQIREPESVGAWMATTVAHECLRSIRRAGRHATTEEGWEEAIVDTDPEADAGVLAAERDKALWKAMGMLSPGCQRLLRLMAVDPAPSYEEVSTVLDMPVGSIGPTRRRCLDHLRAQLARITGEGGGSPR